MEELNLELITAYLRDINPDEPLFKTNEPIKNETAIDEIIGRLTVEHLKNIEEVLFKHHDKIAGFDDEKIFTNTFKKLETKQQELELERDAKEALDLEKIAQTAVTEISDTAATKAVNQAWKSYKDFANVPQDKKEEFDLFKESSLSTARKKFLLEQFEFVNKGTFLNHTPDQTQNLIRLLEILNYSSYNTLADDLTDEIINIISDIITNSTDMKDVATIITLLNDIGGKEEVEMKVQGESGTDTGTVTDGLLSEALNKATPAQPQFSFVEKFRSYVSKCFNDTKKEDPLLAFAREYELGISTKSKLEKGIKVKDIDDMQLFENLGYSKAQITKRYLSSIDISPASASDNIIETLTKFGVAEKQKPTFLRGVNASKFSEIVQKGSYNTEIGHTPSVGATLPYQFGTEDNPLTIDAAWKLKTPFQDIEGTKIIFIGSDGKTMSSTSDGKKWVEKEIDSTDA